MNTDKKSKDYQSGFQSGFFTALEMTIKNAKSLKKSWLIVKHIGGKK